MDTPNQKDDRVFPSKVDITNDPGSSLSTPTKVTPTQTGIYCYRWWVLSAYTLAMFVNSASYGTFIPFSTYFQKIYGISNLSIVMTAMIFQILYLPSSFFLANPFVNSLGTKYAVTAF